MMESTPRHEPDPLVKHYMAFADLHYANGFKAGVFVGVCFAVIVACVVALIRS